MTDAIADSYRAEVTRSRMPVVTALREAYARPIQVGINARYMNSPVSGIERYMVELMQHADAADCVFRRRTIRASIGQHPSKNAIFARLRPFYYAAWDRYMEALEGRQLDIDVFHSPSFIAPKLARGLPSVVTVHDLAFRIFPEFFDRKTKAYYTLFLESSLAEATRIICVSETTASDLIRFFPACKDKVRVVYNGFTDFSQVEPDDTALPALNLVQDQYLLCVGAFNSRKNIQAVLALAPRLSDRYPHLKIAVVGRLPPQEHRWLAPNVIFTGHVTDAALSALYRNAALFVYPSRYEGFGFPMLEAMSVGTPVAYSRSSCLPEVAGLDESHSFDPNCPDQIHDTIVGLLDRGRGGVDGARVRQSLSRFSWERMSRETVEVYRECLR